MTPDISAFPLVWMRNDEAAGHEADDDLFGVFEMLFRRQRPFVLIAEDGPGEHRQSQDDRKQMSLWMKRHRQEMKLIKAMIVVEPSTAKRLAAQAFATMFAKFWGYPLLWANSRDDAVDMANKLLAEKAKMELAGR